MHAIHAVFEKGVFRPIDPVDLQERTLVVFEPQVVNVGAAPRPAQAGIYEVLGRSYETNLPDLAMRHDEHQPNPMAGGLAAYHAAPRETGLHLNVERS